MAAARDDDAVAALRALLAEREATEVRLRGELSELRGHLQARSTAQERLAEMRSALSAELEKVREFAAAEDDRQAEVESRAMVLAAEVEELRAEREVLRERVRGLQDELARRPAPVIAAVPAPRSAPAASGNGDVAARLEAARTRLRQATAAEAAQSGPTGGSPVKLLRQWIERAQSG